MDAYLHTLQLCKEQQQDDARGSGMVMEPRSMEYIAALAAGNQARHLLDVASSAGGGGASSSSSSSPATAVALAIAAARTGGRLVCVRDDQQGLDGVRRHLRRLGLATSAVDFQLAPSPSAAVRRLRRVDFAVVDAGVERCGEVLGAVDVDPMGAIVVVTNVFQEERTSWSSRSGHGDGSRVCSYGQVVGKGRSMVLPIGHGGMEVTKLGLGRRVGGGGLIGAHLQWQRQQKKKLVSTPKRTFLVCDGSS
ncbi:Os08g0110600 [Oryza sativa Japonica Group]|nr:hypothetical protein OsJ_25786 [Oryza sativa Japonica Group]BAD09540.1 unknown protein [Oryza sativa Japonica Group]BAF22735.1 Os08g0110600 [Oryza sativa Japonica Group]|eukprot:NP_001060821.1 Os08g0110600 [Oryza sativa Japonica Group]